MRWQFKGDAPISIKVVIALLFANLLGQFATSYAISNWGLLHPDAAHRFPVRFRGGPTFFVHAWLGQYFTYGLWLHFVFLGLGALLCWIHRDQLERIR